MNCKNCNQSFTIFPEDQKFYGRIDVPEPTHCPACRMQRRYAFRDERVLYQDKCDLCGKNIMSMYGPNSPYIVYCQDCWISDKWDRLAAAQDYDFNKPFIEQFKNLQLKVPRRSLMAMKSVNCDYTNMSADNKDCYLIFAAENNENCLYGKLVQTCKDCVDCNFIYNSELCYECNQCSNCYHCFYCEESGAGTRDCYFSSYLRSCHDCFLCARLFQKSYCILNKQYTPEEYFKKLSEFDWSHEAIQQKLKELEELKKNRMVRLSNQFKSEACTGAYLNACKRVRHSFDITNGQDSAYLTDALDPRDCYDSSFIYYNPQLCYETMSTLNLYNCHFCVFCYQSTDLEYCDLVYSSKNCFGCVGLQKNEYCILNKQYTEEEYKKLRLKIIEQLKKEGLWGELFPMSLSCHPYNDTVAQDYFPLNKEEALKLGCSWNDESAKKYQGPDGISAQDLPGKIKEVGDDILNKVIICERSGRGFKITKQELKFYREMNLPLPYLHPEERHQDRMKLCLPRRLWQRQCVCEQSEHGHAGRCQTEMETSWPPERPERAYCDECYQKELY